MPGQRRCRQGPAFTSYEESLDGGGKRRIMSVYLLYVLIYLNSPVVSSYLCTMEMSTRD